MSVIDEHVQCHVCVRVWACIRALLCSGIGDCNDSTWCTNGPMSVTVAKTFIAYVLKCSMLPSTLNWIPFLSCSVRSHRIRLCLRWLIRIDTRKSIQFSSSDTNPHVESLPTIFVNLEVCCRPELFIASFRHSSIPNHFPPPSHTRTTFSFGIGSVDSWDQRIALHMRFSQVWALWRPNIDKSFMNSPNSN